MSRRRAAAPKDLPLRARVDKGVLRIEIGVDVLAFAALASPFAWEIAAEETGADDSATIDPRTVYIVHDEVEFAREVVRALHDEREDGSSLLTDMLDAATRKAIEDGSQAFATIGDEDLTATKEPTP